MDESRYGELLKEIRPRIIETPEEHERLLSVAESLMEKGSDLGDEEREALALVILLIEAFESGVLADGEDEEQEEEESDEEDEVLPHVAIGRLMAKHGVELGDIAPIFGNPHIASEALEGKRPLTRRQAKDLAEYFSVPASLFLR